MLDVQKPEKESEGLAGVRFYTVDVGDAAGVEKAKGQIEKDVCRYSFLHLSFRSIASVR